MDIHSLKAQIRSILLSLGKTATEPEFRKAFYDFEAKNFNEVLRAFNLSFYDFFMRIPDVARIVYAHNQVYIQRVSNEATSHMDTLTINKYSKNYRGPKLVTKSGAIKGRPMTHPLNVQALPYPAHPRRIAPFQQAVANARAYTPTYTPVRKDVNLRVTVNSDYSKNIEYYEKYHKSASQSAARNVQSPSETNSMASVSETARKIDSAVTQKIEPTVAPKIDSTVTQKIEPTVPPKIDSTPAPKIVPTSTQKVESAPVPKPEVAPKVLSTASPKILPTASTRPTNLGTRPSPLVLKTKKDENLKVPTAQSNANDLAEKVVEKMENLRLDDFAKTVDKENVTTNTGQISSPVVLKNRIRSMRMFREALSQLNLNEENAPQVRNLSLFGTMDAIIELPPPIQNEEKVFFHIKIIDMFSPSKFIFQFSFDKLNDFNGKINRFYSTLNDVEKYRVKDLSVGNIVAVRRDDTWYRGQIKSFNETEVYIQNVDAMKLKDEKVSPKNIFHLHQRFTTESPKSAFGRIHGLKPKDNEWNLLSESKLREMHNKIMLATVKSFDNYIYGISIVVDEENFQTIHDKLIEFDLAEVQMDDYVNESVFRSLV